MGLGMMRTMFDILTGFSLTFSLLPLAMGGAGLIVRRHGAAAPALLRQVAVVYAGTYAVMSGVALRYWFPAPLLFLVVAFACFAAAVATAPRE
jgi:hypothetical protein